MAENETNLAINPRVAALSFSSSIASVSGTPAAPGAACNANAQMSLGANGTKIPQLFVLSVGTTVADVMWFYLVVSGGFAPLGFCNLQAATPSTPWAAPDSAFSFGSARPPKLWLPPGSGYAFGAAIGLAANIGQVQCFVVAADF